MMNVPYVVLKYATLLLSFPINNVVEVVLTTLSAILKSTNNPSHLQGYKRQSSISSGWNTKQKHKNTKHITKRDKCIRNKHFNTIIFVSNTLHSLNIHKKKKHTNSFKL